LRTRTQTHRYTDTQIHRSLLPPSPEMYIREISADVVIKSR
jgi:hypothetical protein